MPIEIERITCPELNSEDTEGKGRREIFVYFDPNNNPPEPPKTFRNHVS